MPLHDTSQMSKIIKENTLNLKRKYRMIMAKTWPGVKPNWH